MLLLQERKRYRNRDFESNTHVHILAPTFVLSRVIISQHCINIVEREGTWNDGDRDTPKGKLFCNDIVKAGSLLGLYALQMIHCTGSEGCRSWCCEVSMKRKGRGKK